MAPRKSKEQLPDFASALPAWITNPRSLAESPDESDPTLGVDEQEPDSTELAEIMAAAGKGFDL
jgi:hypothetical protein